VRGGAASVQIHFSTINGGLTFNDHTGFASGQCAGF
jgi:hypothetical protein